MIMSSFKIAVFISCISFIAISLKACSHYDIEKKETDISANGSDGSHKITTVKIV